MDDYIDIVFDGPPGPESGRFVEVEDSAGRSISFGEWVERSDGLWALRITPGVDKHQPGHNHDGPPVWSLWHPLDKNMKYRHCMVQFCNVQESKAVK